jgi:hypothetical protein
LKANDSTRRCYVGWQKLKEVLASDKLKEYKFTLSPKFMPYLINEGLDDQSAISKKELYETKFMGMLLRVRDMTSSGVDLYYHQGGDNAEAVRNKISRAGSEVGIDFSWDNVRHKQSGPLWSHFKSDVRLHRNRRSGRQSAPIAYWRKPTKSADSTCKPDCRRSYML